MNEHDELLPDDLMLDLREMLTAAKQDDDLGPGGLMLDLKGMLTVADVCRSLKISRSTLYEKLRSDSTFPKPRKLGTSVRWLEDELEEYQNNLPEAEYTDK